MKIYVCVKHVPDSAAKITFTGEKEYDESVKFVMNPYDEHAVEEALKMKEANAGAEVIVVTLGKDSAKTSIRSALAMGADRAILIKTDALLDHGAVAKGLHKAIANDGQPAIIFAGKVSIDSEGMQTQYRLAHAFDMPCLTNVVAFSPQGEKCTVEREVEGGAREVYEVTLPCLLSADKGLNKPRYPKLPDIMKAKKKPIAEIDFSALGVSNDGGKMELLSFALPPEKPEGKVLQGEPAELASQLVKLLKEEAKVL